MSDNSQPSNYKIYSISKHFCFFGGENPELLDPSTSVASQQDVKITLVACSFVLELNFVITESMFCDLVRHLL